ncbi:hypothetical protein E1B28_007947 [Marasmius oreades]|uniref:Protein kinase domain-containing protein n=1 Tax=Marasmius oreades TaxID=181124 RepID=A0A9P7S2X9_9AGAR|nr:uncharacterized protein E1B28_007947 [Marasmius oreades]KAG7094347.1 hypothetical protein E1B28_007947 [Marasmius oreades]
MLDESSSSTRGSVRGASYLVRGSWEGKQVLVKKLLPECRQHILSRYASSWHDLKHPNMLSVCGVSQSSEEPLFIVLPYHENGNLQAWIASQDGVDRNRLILDVALGMQYLHARQMVHGSLMPCNILINGYRRACLSDYTMLQLQPSRNNNAHRYYSPEAWKGMTSQPSDVFAFAICAFELFASSIPWGVLTEQRIYRLVVLEDARPDRPDDQTCRRYGLSDRIWSIIEEAWHKESRLRPTFDIILRLWQDEVVDSPTTNLDPAMTFDIMDRKSHRASQQTTASVYMPISLGLLLIRMLLMFWNLKHRQGMMIIRKSLVYRIHLVTFNRQSTRLPFRLFKCIIP